MDPKFSGAAISGAADETIISQQFDKPVMVHRYPSAIKAFYMEPDPARPEVALCLDVLAPEGYGEIIGGGQRTSSYELLVQRIKEHDLPREVFEWYLDLRKFGSVPHAGFGMGIERAVTWICGLEHVARDDSLSPNALPAESLSHWTFGHGTSRHLTFKALPASAMSNVGMSGSIAV